MYNFLFDKRSLVLLVTGTAVAGGALFFSGMLVGVQYGLPADPEPVVITRPVPAKPAANRPCLPEPAVPVQVVTVPTPAPDPRASAGISEPEPQPEPPPPAPVPTAAVAQAPEPTPDGPARYSLQIGAFREAKNSEKTIQELQSKGYEPYVIEQKGRSVLQTVRVGRYAGRAEALRAAADFRRREGMEAIVRPLGS
jgi:cell division septation protein DedD